MTMMPDKRPVRIVALDLDGTLLNSRGEIASDDIAALRMLHQRGVQVCLASGRMTAAIRPTFGVIGVDGPVIAYNGAMVRDSLTRGEAVILEIPLPARYGDYLVDYAERERHHLNYYRQDLLYAGEDPALRRFADLYAKQTGSVFHFVRSLQQFKGCQPTKIILITDPTVPGRPDPRHRDELYEAFEAKWDGEVSLFKTNPEYLEFLNRDVDKGVALEALARYFNVPRGQVMAFGDGENDAPMLAWAGVGVAVSNAKPKVKAVADVILPYSNDDSPIAHAVEELVDLEPTR
jgi:hypothetical protein